MSDIVILAAGERCISLALSVEEELKKQGLDASIVNACFLKPLDRDLLSSRKENLVVTLEDNVKAGGLGAAIAEFYRNTPKIVLIFGYDDAFLPHAEVSSLMEKHGLGRDKIVGEILKYARR